VWLVNVREDRRDSGGPIVDEFETFLIVHTAFDDLGTFGMHHANLCFRAE